MEQGCPHRSILPHIFPDCNSFAIKIGGKFCGVRGVCPGGAACLGVAGSAGVSGTQRGACRLCRLLTLPLTCFLAPLPRRGRIDPRPLFPGGEGGDFLLSYARGCAPCIPGAEPARHWFALPLWKTQWGLASALPARRASAVPGGGACLLCRLLTLPLAYFFAPIPQPPSRREGVTIGYFMQGAAPLASPGLNPGGTGYACGKLVLWALSWHRHPPGQREPVL